ncbi:sensor histidine kinase [Microbispora siamensis]
MVTIARSVMGRTREDGASGRALDLFAARFAAGLRVGSTSVALIAAPLWMTHDVSLRGLTVVLTVLVVWSVLFAVTALRDGLSPLLVVGDTALITAILLLHGRIAPHAAIADGTTWVLVVASTAVLIPQIMLSPWVSLPVAGAVTAAYVHGAPTPTDGSFLLLQALVTALLKYLLRQGGQAADRVVSRQLKTIRAGQVESARQNDEIEQHNRLHDTVLATLTMAASGSIAAGSTTLATQAASDLRTLQELAAGTEPEQAGASTLMDRLGRIAAVAPVPAVELLGSDAEVPPLVAVRISECVAEALLNVARHAEVTSAVIKVAQHEGGVEVEVRDQGRGFDVRHVYAGRRGVRGSIVARMLVIGGSADITSVPGAGTCVRLRWPHE